MEFLLLIAVVVVGYLIVNAIKVNGESNRKTVMEASPDYQSKVRAIRDMIHFKDKHVSCTELIYQYKAYIEDSKDPKRRKELLREIEKINKERISLAEEFHTKYKNDPYDPMKIPLDQFPDELLQQYEAIELRLKTATHTRS